MKHDEIKRLAEKLGFDALDVPLLSIFTQAVIEDYKASLVPVALRYYTFYESGFTEDVEDFVLYPHAEKLYALGEAK